MPSLDDFASTKLESLAARGQRRELTDTARKAAGTALRSNRDVISFCCNDYLNLSQHHAVKKAAQDAVEEFEAESWMFESPPKRDREISREGLGIDEPLRKGDSAIFKDQKF